jgi:hypothetical protein
MTEADLAIAMSRSAAETMQRLHAAEMVDRIGAVCGDKKGGRPRKHSRNLSDYEACLRRGMTRQQTAKHLGVTEAAVDYMAKQYPDKLPFRDARRKKA